MTKFSSTNFQKMLSPSYTILRIQRLEGNSIDLDEVAHSGAPILSHLIKIYVVRKFSYLCLW